MAPPEAERAHGPAMHNARARQAPHQLNGQPLGPLGRGARHGNDPHGRQQSLHAIASGALATTTSPSAPKTLNPKPASLRCSALLSPASVQHSPFIVHNQRLKGLRGYTVFSLYTNFHTSFSLSLYVLYDFFSQT